MTGKVTGHKITEISFLCHLVSLITGTYETIMTHMNNETNHDRVAHTIVVYSTVEK